MEKENNICKKHGQTKFINGKCLQCLEENLYLPIYRIEEKIENGNKKFYILGDEINDNHYLNNFLWLLTDKNKKTISMLMNDFISEVPGVYGIFYKKKNGKAGECLYIGQSVNIKNRIEEHKNNILQAKKDLINHQRTQESLYYNLAFIGYDNIKFVQLIDISKDIWNNLNKDQASELLTVFEQYCMDCYSPRYNKTAARPSRL